MLLLPFATRKTAATSFITLIWMIPNESADPLYRFIRNGKAGYIDSDGKVIIEPRFEVHGNSGGVFYDGLLDTNDGFVNRTGEVVLKTQFYRTWTFSEGLAAALREKGDKWGYIDHSGKFVIGPRFEDFPNGYVSSFSEGLALIEVLGKYGYIDHSGKFVIPPRFLYGRNFRDGMACVMVDNPHPYAEAKFCPDFRPLFAVIQGTSPECKFTFINQSGSVISSDRYDYAKDFSEGFAPVRIAGKWGYIDKKGRIIIRPQYDDAMAFSNGVARVRQGNLYGYIDISGAFTVTIQFEYAEDFADGLAVVGPGDWRKGDYYYIDKHGQQAIAEKYGLASTFFRGLAHVRLDPVGKVIGDEVEDKGGTYAYIKTTGERVFTYKP
ncbi:MAG TPA: WG repeat-containing protein [Blastocatellia bacterium]